MISPRLRWSMMALCLAACGNVGLHGGVSATATTAPSLGFNNPNIVVGLERGGGAAVSAPPAGTSARISSAQAEAIAADDPNLVNAGPPTQAVLVQYAYINAPRGTPQVFPSDYPTAASGQTAGPTLPPLNSPLPPEWYQFGPCVCWVIDRTPPNPGLDPVHARFAVKFMVTLVDADTGVIRLDEEG